MNEYYAIVRSGDHLSHYGVLGMKWGVRKAVDHHGEKTLGKHYAKVQAKLKKAQSEKKKQKQSTTNSETDFVRSSGELKENKRAMKDIHKVLRSNAFENLTKATKDYVKAKDNLDSAFSEYDKKLTKLRKGKPWDGDGSEEHDALIKHFPKYATMAKTYDTTKRSFANEVESAVKSGKFDRIHGRSKHPDYYYNYGKKHGFWYQKGDSRSYAVASAAIQRETGNQKHEAGTYDIFPEHFIRSYDKNGKRIKHAFDAWG